MTDEEYQEFLEALARKHLHSRPFYHRMQTEETIFLIERLSAAGRLNQAAVQRPDSAELRHALVEEVRLLSINAAVDVMDRAGVVDALDEGSDLLFENLRRSVIPTEDIALLREAGIRDPEAEMTIIIHYTRRNVGRDDTRASTILRAADAYLERAISLLHEDTSSKSRSDRHIVKRRPFNSIGKILAGAVTGLGNTLLGFGTIVAPSPAMAYGVIASAALAVGSICQGIGDLRGE